MTTLTMPQPSYTTAALRVLLVEDSRSDALLVEEALRDAWPAPVDVNWLERLGDLSREILSDGHGCILLDLSLPDAHGLEAVLAVRAFAPMLPLIVLTGRDDVGAAIEAVRAGAQDYLVKGRFDPEVLIRAIRHAMERARVEEALRTSEDRLRLMVEGNADFAMFTLDPVGRVDSWNLGAQRLLGHRPEDVVQRGAGRVLSNGDAGAVDAWLAESAAQRRFSQVGEVSRPDGTSFLAETVITPHLGKLGDLLGHVVVVRDLSERETAARVLKEAERRLEAIVDNTPVLVFTTDSTGRVTYAAGRALADLGVTPDGVLGTSPALGADAVRFADNVARALLGDEFSALVSIADRVYDTWYSPLRDDSRGISGVLGVATDVTDRRRAERALQEREEYYRTLVDQGSDILAAVDPDGTVAYASPAIERILGVPPADVIGDRVTALAHPDHQAAARADLKACLSGTKSRFGWRALHRDGSVRHLEFEAFRAEGVASLPGLVLSARDVTEREADEQVRNAALELLERIARGASLDEVLHGVGGLVDGAVNGARMEVIGRSEVRVTTPDRELRPWEHTVAALATRLAEIAFDRDRIVGELARRSTPQDPEDARAVLKELRSLGVRLAIDDFGTGYSSLAYLKRFGVDVLKIDRTFVSGLGEDQEDSAIVAAVIGLACTVGAVPVAEGVETPDQVAALSALGCTLAQGFLWARPGPAEELVRLVLAAPTAVARLGMTA